MTELDKESVTKLNAEINYYLNHQYTIYVSAVTLLGAVMAWVAQRVSVAEPGSIDIAYLAFMGVSLFLVLGALLEARLNIAVSICGTYLRLSAASRWEVDIAEFRSMTSDKIGLTTRGTFYIALGVLTLSWPLFLCWINFQAIALSVFFVAHICMALFYFVAVFLLIPWGVRLREHEIENVWSKILRR